LSWLVPWYRLRRRSTATVIAGIAITTVIAAGDSSENNQREARTIPGFAFFMQSLA
jgi:hypothetical protein